MRFQADLTSFGNIDWGLTQMFHISILIIPTVIFLYKYFLYGIEITALDKCMVFHLRVQHEHAISSFGLLTSSFFSSTCKSYKTNLDLL